RSKCQNQLKQIGIALHTHQDELGVMPPGLTRNSNTYNGGVVPPRPRLFQEPRVTEFWPWMVFILPYLEEKNVYGYIHTDQWPWWQNPIDWPYHNQTNPQYPVNGYPMKIYQCPSDNRSYLIDNYGGILVALTGYMGVSGSNQWKFDGVLAVNTARKLSDIKDGTSNTIMVGEKPPSYELLHGGWQAGSGDVPPSFGSSDVVLGTAERRHTPGAVRQRFGPGQLEDPNEIHQFHYWSLHPGGCNFLFADGSVKMIGYSFED